MKKIMLYVLLGLATFTIYLLLKLPAAPFWQNLDPQLRAKLPELNIISVDGTVWTGGAHGQFLNFPISRLKWDLAILKLFTGTVGLDLSLDGEGHQINAIARITSSEAEVTDLSGYLAAEYINTVSAPQGLIFSGKFTGEDLNFSSDLVWLTAASGTIEWPGGEITSRLNAGQSQTVNLPPLSGNISLLDNVLWLHIHQSGKPLVNIAVEATGKASVTVLARLFDLAGLSLPGDTDLDSPVLEFEESVF